MTPFKSKLLSATVIPAVMSAGFVISAITPVNHVQAASTQVSQDGLLPTAKPRPVLIQLAASCNPCAVNPCNPCAVNPCNPCAANPCNPCAANPCNPCAANPCNPCAANPCNPCAANPCNPCAANPCNPCAVNPCNPCAANPCNPCAANPCNPCAANPCNPCAANPCNPCAANPCNPCGASSSKTLNPCEAAVAYQSIEMKMKTSYAKAGIASIAGYQSWVNVSSAPYVSDTHAERYVNNYVNAVGAIDYAKYEDGGTMPVGTVLAKDSFSVDGSGKAKVGPMFIMEKMPIGFSAASMDWRYSMIQPNGKVVGITNGLNSDAMTFCNDCHEAAEDNDFLFFLPEESRR